jgi:hypothetical protein
MDGDNTTESEAKVDMTLSRDLSLARATAEKFSHSGNNGAERPWPDNFSYLQELTEKFKSLCDIPSLLSERMKSKGENKVLEIFSDGTPEYMMFVADPPLATKAVSAALSERSYVTHQNLDRVAGDIYSESTWQQISEKGMAGDGKKFDFVIGKPNMGWVVLDENGKERPPGLEMYTWLVNKMYTQLNSDGGVLLLENDHGFNGDPMVEKERFNTWVEEMKKVGLEVSVDDSRGYNLMIKKNNGAPERLPKVK